MFDRYKRTSNGQFAADLRGRKNVPISGDVSTTRTPQWKRSTLFLQRLTPPGLDLPFIPTSENRKPDSGYFDGFVRVYGITFELKAKRSATGAIRQELHTTGFGRSRHITSAADMRSLIEEQSKRLRG